MRRIYIPKLKPGPEQGSEPVALDEAQVTAVAEKIHAAAVAGEPFEKLQQQAYDDLGLTTEPPEAEAVTLTRDQMPDEHIAAFDMESGEVFEPFNESSAIYIYKV